MRGVVWGALRREPRLLVRIGVWSLLEAAPAVLIGHAVARAIEDGFAAGSPGTGLVWLAALGAAWALAAVAARQVVLAVAGIAEPFRDDLLTRVVEDAVHAREPRDSAAVARAGLQVELARDAFAAVVTTVRGFAFTVAGVVVGLSTLVPGALVLVLPAFVAGLTLFLASLPALARRQRAFLVADEELSDAMTGLAGGLRDIVACGDEDRADARLSARVARQAAAARSLARMTAVRTAALAVGGWLPVVLVLAGTPRLLAGGAGAGVIVGTLAYVTQSLAPALNGLIQGLGVSGVRLAATLARITAAAPPRPPVSARLTPPGAEVRLRGVTFAYGPHSEPVVDRLDLRIPEGDHLAVVGPSGAGKSTLAALVAGTLRPGAGEVLVGGIPAPDVHPAARVLIPQEAYVFRGTLRDNLTYLREPPTEEAETPAGAAGEVRGAGSGGGHEVDAVLDRAVAELGARELVEAVGGYGAVVDPGALPAGQRQLVALVRAYVAPARLVILDEATCHLDPAAEARVERAFVRRGGTLVVVAHRLTSALRARRILLLDGGRAIVGGHDELVAASPLYADLAGHWEPETVS
ncbi:ABC transporter ATP-binding protein [Nonomuraea sp. NPDC049725]|uniref:ABC transporter ATP-binding protein n=1 Tax=Nonomuraea sp. NPDC049725 TaxID=3154508 RepID=UPI00342C68B8